MHIVFLLVIEGHWSVKNTTVVLIKISGALAALPHNAQLKWKCAWCSRSQQKEKNEINNSVWCWIPLLCIHWDQVFFHGKLKKKKKKGAAERVVKTGLGQTAPGCHCQALLVSSWPLARALPARARTQSHSRAHPSNPRSESKHTISITVRGESAHASETTIKYLLPSSSDFDSTRLPQYLLESTRTIQKCCSFEHLRKNSKEHRAYNIIH